MNKLMIFITLLTQAVLFSQTKEKIHKADSLKGYLAERQKKIDSLKKIDFIGKTYRYLDSDYKIKIDKNTFDKIILKKEVTVETYKDSLMLVLIYELKSNEAANIAFHRILFSWKKMSIYIWETEQKTKNTASSLGFKHPYRFFEFLTNSKTDNPKKLEILTILKSKMSQKDIDKIDLKPYNEFLNYAFKNNPERLKK
jgi:hypothetical protein